MSVDYQTNLADEARIIVTPPTALDVLELALIELISNQGVDRELVLASIESAAAETRTSLPPQEQAALSILLNSLAAARRSHR